jgi:hypothetical protein
MNPTLAIVALVLSIMIPTFVYIMTSTPEFKEVEKKDVKAEKPSANKPAAKKPAAKAAKAKEAVKQYKATGKTTDSSGKPVELAVVKNRLKLVESAPAVKPAVKSSKPIPAAKPAPAAKPEVKAEEKVQIIDQVVADIMKPAEPKAAETTTPTTTQPEEKKAE